MIIDTICLKGCSAMHFLVNYSQALLIDLTQWVAYEGFRLHNYESLQVGTADSAVERQFEKC